MDNLNEVKEQIITLARGLFADSHDDIQIDDDAEIKPVSNGAWVAAWVFLTIPVAE